VNPGHQATLLQLQDHLELFEILDSAPTALEICDLFSFDVTAGGQNQTLVECLPYSTFNSEVGIRARSRIFYQIMWFRYCRHLLITYPRCAIAIYPFFEDHF
jgi:hypothetical protein